MYCFHCGARVNEKADFCHKCGRPVVKGQASTQTSPLEKLDAGSLPEFIGKYNVKELIGIGGMGEVYRAYDENLKRMVAIKVLPSRLAKREGYAERFIAEAQRSAELEHPNIVMIHDVGQDAGRTYFVMNHVVGRSLEKLIAERPIEIKRGLQLVVQLTRALGYAHSKGVIHCDVKPGNVIVGSDNHVTLLDFGIARAAASQDNTAVGTPEYMSPEQCQGQSVDARSDIYSLGILMYKLFTRRLPFTADKKVAVAFKQINEPPIPPRILESRIPEWLNTIILKCLEKNPLERYQTTAELANDIDAGLRRLYAEEKQRRENRPKETLTTAERWRYKRRLLVGIGLTAVVAAGLTWGLIKLIPHLTAEEEELGNPLDEEMVLNEDEVTIEINSNPDSAEVFIDDKRFGTTPLNTRLLRGKTYLLRFEREGYAPLETEFTPGRADIVNFDVQLNPATYGWINIHGPAGYQVWLDGRYLGTLPLSPIKTLSGKRTLRLEGGGDVINREVYVTEERTTPVYLGGSGPSNTTEDEGDGPSVEEAENLLLGDD